MMQMANLGNAWHIPANPEPRGVAGMRDPVFPTAQWPCVRDPTEPISAHHVAVSAGRRLAAQINTRPLGFLAWFLPGPAAHVSLARPETTVHRAQLCSRAPARSGLL